MTENDEFWARQHETGANTPITWRMKADDLLAASRILRRERDAAYLAEREGREPIPDGRQAFAPELRADQPTSGDPDVNNVLSRDT